MKVPIGETAVVIRTNGYETEQDIREIYLIVLVQIHGYYETGESYGYITKTLKQISIGREIPSSKRWHKAWIEDAPFYKKTQDLSKIPNLPDWVKRGKLWSVS